MSMQPTFEEFEEWVQMLKLYEFDEQLVWRQEKYTALTERKIQPSYPGEKAKLAKEIRILTKRYRVLESDNNCNLEAVDMMLRFFDQLEENKEDGIRGFEEINLQGLQVRREILFARRKILTQDRE